MNMKTSAFKILIVLILSGITVFSAFSQEIAEKKFNKVWSTSSKKVFEVFNKFGDITLKTWEKNEISVDVSIRVENYPKDKADMYLQLININYVESDSLLKLVTFFDEKVEKALNNQSDNKKIRVDYTVYHPVYQKVKLNNRYGDIAIDELNGKSTFNLKYGDFSANNMIFDETKPFSQLDIAFGKATIKKTSWMQFNISYADLNTEEATAMIIISKYSNITGGVIHSMVADSKYDDYTVFKLKNFIIESKYSGLTLNEVDKQMHVTMEYGNVKVKTVPAGFEKIKVDSKFSGCDLYIDETACYRLNSEVEYGEVKVPQKASINRKTGSSSEVIEGFVGCIEGASSEVELKGKYSDFSLIK